MTRRKFLISLGTGAAASIAGYFLVSEGALPTSSGGGDHELPIRPRLREDVTFAEKDGLLTVTRRDGEQKVMCAVNRLGADILKRLDGRHTIADIRRAVLPGTDNQGSDEMEAKIAYFVAQTGMFGLLARPFYATIYEVQA